VVKFCLLVSIYWCYYLTKLQLSTSSLSYIFWENAPFLAQNSRILSFGINCVLGMYVSVHVFSYNFGYGCAMICLSHSPNFSCLRHHYPTLLGKQPPFLAQNGQIPGFGIHGVLGMYVPLFAFI